MSEKTLQSQIPFGLASVQPLLISCGYRSTHIQTFDTTDQSRLKKLVAFSHSPFDARSACVSVVETTGDSAEAVVESREFAAPIALVCRPAGIEWWQQGDQARRIGPPIPPEGVGPFFRRHQDDFAPDAVYRAKTWGRFDRQFQRSFVDLGLMPRVEARIGQSLQDLISSNVQLLKAELNWKTLSVKQGAWLLKAVFWLVSAKMLRDKSVHPFTHIELSDIERVIASVGEHFGADRIPVAEKQLIALRAVAERINRHSSLQLATTESLAHVYENTLISKETRQSLGTHSTPSYLVDYIVGRMKPLIEEIDYRDRRVFEPACGHAAFLVSAMRLLTELHPEGASAEKRRRYLRQRIRGCEIDDFALEIARLSLSLTDIPNPNGWDLRLGDMFVRDTLEAMSRDSTILLANPPFENFTPEDKGWYSKRDIGFRYVNKSAEMLGRVLPALPQGAVVGLVLPQGLLHSKNAFEIRRMLLSQFEVTEICQFPDKVFVFGDAESAVLIAKKTSQGAGVSGRTILRRVREKGMDAFRQSYAVESERIVEQRLFDTSTADMRVRDLDEIWSFCESSDFLELRDVAEVGKGLEYVSPIPKGLTAISQSRFPKSVRGFAKFERHLQLHELPRESWMSVDTNVVRAKRHGATSLAPQVLCNYARVSRGVWRLKGLIDTYGHVVTTRFVVVRPDPSREAISCETLWAIVNSPLLNAYIFATCGKRDNLTGQIERFRIPRITREQDAEVRRHVSAYMAYVSPDPDAVLRKPINAEKARTLMLRVDAAILRLYNLPVDLERQLLDYFAGWPRGGVPFKSDRYYPEHFRDAISLTDYLAITSDWPQTNRRRGELIHKKVARSITPGERRELDRLQSLATSRANLLAPLPMAELERLHREVVGCKE